VNKYEGTEVDEAIMQIMAILKSVKILILRYEEFNLEMTIKARFKIILSKDQILRIVLVVGRLMILILQ